MLLFLFALTITIIYFARPESEHKIETKYCYLCGEEILDKEMVQIVGDTTTAAVRIKYWGHKKCMKENKFMGITT